MYLLKLRRWHVSKSAETNNLIMSMQSTFTVVRKSGGVDVVCKWALSPASSAISAVCSAEKRYREARTRSGMLEKWSYFHNSIRKNKLKKWQKKMPRSIIFYASRGGFLSWWSNKKHHILFFETALKNVKMFCEKIKDWSHK